MSMTMTVKVMVTRMTNDYDDDIEDKGGIEGDGVIEDDQDNDDDDGSIEDGQDNDDDDGDIEDGQDNDDDDGDIEDGQDNDDHDGGIEDGQDNDDDDGGDADLGGGIQLHPPICLGRLNTRLKNISRRKHICIYTVVFI